MFVTYILHNTGLFDHSNTMGCLPVHGDNLRTLAMDTNGIAIIHHLHNADLAHHEIFRAKVGKGSIILELTRFTI